MLGEFARRIEPVNLPARRPGRSNDLGLKSH